MRFFSIFILAAIVTSALATPPSIKWPTTYGGTACPQGSVIVSTNPGASAFYFKFINDVYKMKVGPGVASSDLTSPRHKYCNIYMNINTPIGWRVRIVNFSYNESASLQPDAIISHETASWFSSDSPLFDVGRSKSPIPYSISYKPTVTTVNMPNSPWSLCGAWRSLSFFTRATIDNFLNSAGTSTFQIHLFKVAVEWQQC